MNTVVALLILFASCTIGLGVIGIVILLMGLAGSVGALIFEAGRSRDNEALRLFGFALTALGQTFVVCGYCVFVVSALRAFSHAAPAIPVWPLWIAAFFHSVAVPTHAMREPLPDTPSSQHMTLWLVGTAAFVCFWMMAFAPRLLSWLYGWIPFFHANINL